MFLVAQTAFMELQHMMDERFDLFTITRELIDIAITAMTICTIILFVLVCPAAGIRTMIGRTFLSLSRRALDMFPAWNQRLYAPDSLNRNFMFINSNTDASDPINVRRREEALVTIGFYRKNQSLPFIEPYSLY
jgi:hypothetical protein